MGCGLRFARAEALGRHFHRQAGRICIKTLIDEEILNQCSQLNPDMDNMSLPGPSAVNFVPSNFLRLQGVDVCLRQY